MNGKSHLFIFDFDGTLADSFGWFIANFNTTAEKFGFRPIRKQEIDDFRCMDPQTLRVKLKVPLWKLPFIAYSMRCRMGADIGQIQPFPGIKTVLKNLSRRHTLALVTSNSRKNVQGVLGYETFSLFKHAEFNVGMFGKPSALRSVIQKCAFDPRFAFYVGDEIRDLEATQKAKMPFGAVGWGYCPLDALAVHKPDMVFQRVGDLNKLMKVLKR